KRILQELLFGKRLLEILGLMKQFERLRLLKTVAAWLCIT
ncbi:MAG: hypothetical protein ACI9XO_002498, partial [Paraglaciecola sp.]